MSLVPPFHHALAAGLVGLICFGSAGSARATAGDAGTVPAAADAQGAAAATAPAVPDASPAVLAAISQLQDKAFTGAFAKDDVAAALQFYSARKDPLWIDAQGVTARAKGLADEISKAEQWGLDAKSFPLPDLSQPAAGADAQGRAEAQLSLAALTYARHAKGGRVRPLSISQLLDLTPPVRDPAAVLKELETSADPAAYLVGLHPKHEQFQRLRAELVKRMGPVEAPPPVDPALLVKLPADGATIKPGSLHPHIALLRKRLKQPPAFAGQETLYDEKLAEAVKTFQAGKGLKANGQLNNRTRTALNREGEPAAKDNQRDTQRIVVNMERWRWMPEDLGTSYVINNVPEYVTRMYKGGSEIFKEKIIVGLPEWPTPSFSAEMKTIVFNPSWGVPDGIKAKELKPRLQRAGGSVAAVALRSSGPTASRPIVMAGRSIRIPWTGRPPICASTASFSHRAERTRLGL
jgi:L,D-transpeptidase YcbB